MIMGFFLSQDVFICPESAIFISIAQVTMICEAHGGKRRDSLIQEAKDPEWAGLFLQMLFPILYIFSLS